MVSISHRLALVVSLTLCFNLCSSLTKEVKIYQNPGFVGFGVDYKAENGLIIEERDISGSDEREHHNLRRGPTVPVVVARFEDGLQQTGWGILDLETSAAYHDGVQAFTAGFAEGYLTAHQIAPMAKNVAFALFGKIVSEKDENGFIKMPQVLVDFFQEQEDWTMELVQKNNDDYYFQVGLVMEQFDGLIAGYERKRSENPSKLPKLPRWVFHMMNGSGDLNDLTAALVTKDNSFDYFEMNLNEVEFNLGLHSSCSALVKVTPGNEDLLVGHSSWFSFGFMNRIFKHYLLNFNHEKTAAKGISFSSYPGFLESLDDFYMLDSGITWTQTSNGVLDRSVYKDSISAQSLLAWQRVRVASAMSSSGSEFFEFLKPHHSGTYANQYIVVDMKLFKPGNDLLPGTLWIVEEMPGVILGQDMTEILKFGYWPSYNVPFFEEIYIKSGYKALHEKFKSEKPNAFSYSLAPRGEIFRRDEHSVKSLADLKRILRSNDFKSDEYSEGNPMLSLCSRYDLVADESKVRPYGCYDTKATSFLSGALQRKAEIINGPTWKGDDAGSYIEQFSWEKFQNYEHAGLPQTFHFDFIKTKPFYTDFQNKMWGGLRTEEI